MRKEFKKFLKSHKAYRAFVRNCKDGSCRGVSEDKPLFASAFSIATEYRPINYVSSSFTWAKTKQGNVFWSWIDLKWRREVEQKQS